MLEGLLVVRNLRYGCEHHLADCFLLNHLLQPLMQESGLSLENQSLVMIGKLPI